MSHPAMWTCPACGRPLTVALNPEGGEAGAHRPLEISRASAAAHACAPAARFPQFHNASSSSITGYEPASCQPWQPPVSAGAEDDEGVISQSEYTLTKPSSCPNHLLEVRLAVGTVLHPPVADPPMQRPRAAPAERDPDAAGQRLEQRQHLQSSVGIGHRLRNDLRLPHVGERVLPRPPRPRRRRRQRPERRSATCAPPARSSRPPRPRLPANVLPAGSTSAFSRNRRTTSVRIRDPHPSIRGRKTGSVRSAGAPATGPSPPRRRQK